MLLLPGQDHHGTPRKATGAYAIHAVSYRPCRIRRRLDLGAGGGWRKLD